MKLLMNFFRGMVVLIAKGPFPERLMNLCAQRGIDFWAVEWLDEGSIRMTTRWYAIGRVWALAERVNCTIQVEGRRGVPDFASRFRTRYAFLLGLALSLCAVAVLSRFVLNIEVAGNQKVDTAVILSELHRQGVKPGVYGPSLDRVQVTQAALLNLKELSWMAINRHGTRLEVIVREVVPSPERVDEEGFYDIVAEADGVITHVEAELGDAKVKDGDVVLAGDVLISGTVTMEPPKYSDLPPRYYQTHARGRVWAETWRTLTTIVPMEAPVKEYTGKGTRAWTLELFGKRLHLFGAAVTNPNWEKENQKWRLILPGEVELPICLTIETSREYGLGAAQMNLENTQGTVEKHLAERLKDLIGEKGEVEKTDFTAKVEQGLLKVSLRAQCREEIGKETPGRPIA